MTLWRLTGSAGTKVVIGSILRLVQSLFLGVAFGAAMRLVVFMVRGEAVTPDIARTTGLLCVVSLLGQLILGWISARLCWLASYKAVARLRLNLLGHVRVIPLNSLGKRSRGDIAALISTDLQLIEDFLSEGIPRLGQALGIPLLVIVAVGLNKPLLGAAIAVPIIVMVPVMSWSARKIAALGDRRQATQAGAAARMIDLVSGMPALRVFSTRERTEHWFGAAVDEFRDISVRMVHRLIVPITISGLVLMCGVPLMIAISGYSLSTLGGDAALVSVVFVLVLNVYQPVQGLLATNEGWQLAQAALRRVTEVLDIAPLPEPDVPAPSPSVADVEFDSVSYHYPDGSSALKDVSFLARQGHMTAIVGPSGSGKTTVLNLIARFDDPQSGAVTIGGTRVKDIDAPARSELVTVVFQDVHLFPGTIADNIAVGRPSASRDEIVAAARLAQADGFITDLPDGYDTVLGEDGAGLSGGQRQRLSIARAALKDAPIVLLDEVTSALDPINEAAVHRGLNALLEGRTAIVVAHKLGTIAKADHIVVLDGGRSVEQGTHGELLQRGGLYARLWQRIESSAEWTLHGGGNDDL